MTVRDIETLKVENMNLADKIYIFDTTLRDGEQTPGVALTVDEKFRLPKSSIIWA
jgi:2-isopropylmalate synthase